MKLLLVMFFLTTTISTISLVLYLGVFRDVDPPSEDLNLLEVDQKDSTISILDEVISDRVTVKKKPTELIDSSSGTLLEKNTKPITTECAGQINSAKQKSKRAKNKIIPIEFYKEHDQQDVDQKRKIRGQNKQSIKNNAVSAIPQIPSKNLFQDTINVNDHFIPNEKKTRPQSETERAPTTIDTRETKAPPRMPEKSTAELCVKMNSISFNENDIFSPSDQARLTEKYLDQCLTSKMIKNLLNEVNQFYLSRGYVTTKAFLINQDISDGEIELKVMVGFIEDIQFKNGTESKWRVKSAFAFQKGNVLNIRNLENALENVNRLPSRNAKFSLEPGSNHGLTKVVISEETSPPIRFSFGASGGKTPEYEEPSFNLSLQYDNFFNLNDTISFSANGSELLEEYQGSSSYELNYVFPVGSTLLDFTYSKTGYQQEVVGNMGNYLSEGETTGYKIQVNKKLTRNQSSKLELKFSVNFKKSENFFEKERVEVSSYTTNVVAAKLNHTYLFSSGQINSGLALSFGTDWFGADSDKGFNAEEEDVEFRPRFEFTKLVLNSNLSYYLKKSNSPWIIDLNFKCQLSDDILHSSEKIAVGNAYSVRGYNDRYYTGNNGWFLKTDLKKTIKLSVSDSLLSGITAYVGADVGEVICQPDTKETCGGLMGVSMGVNSVGSILTSSLSIEKPLTNIGDDFNDSPLLKYSFHASF